MANDERTIQERDPHPRLVEARKIVESTGKTRKDAAAYCNCLTHAEVDAVLESGGDKAKLDVALLRVQKEANEKHKKEAERLAKEEADKKKPHHR